VVEDLPPQVECEHQGQTFHLRDGSVVIAAITSCTNTSNPSVMIGAGLLAKKAIAKGLRTKPWVKTSLAPGSRVVTGYPRRFRAAGVARRARFPDGGLRLHDMHRQQRAAAEAIGRRSRSMARRGRVLSGNRNFEARVHPSCAPTISRRRC
jgi:aconitate hydratase